MLDILNKAIIGIFMMVQTIDSAIDITHPSSTPLPTPFVLKSPSPTPKVNTYKNNSTYPALQQNSQNNQVTQPTITHDGSRTGPIVDYYSYCDQKTIKVYENERVPFTSSEGKQIY